MVTCREYYNKLKTIENQPFVKFPNGINEDWINFYNTNYKNLDRIYLYRKYKSLGLDADMTIEPDEIIENSKEIGMFLYSRKHELNRIYDALHEEYNPLWNVDGTEKITHSQADTLTFNTKDAKTIEGEIINTRTGDDTNTQTGSISNVHSENINFSLTDENLSSDKSTYNSVKNRTEYDSETSTNYNNYKDENVKTGSETTSYGHVIETERSGNIGVTQSQTLLESEMRVRMLYNFFDIFYEMIMEVYSCGCYFSDMDGYKRSRYVLNNYSRDIFADNENGDLMIGGDF